LPIGSEFPQIMPESGEVTPSVGEFGFGGILGKHFCGELGGPEGDFVEVTVSGLHGFAFLAGAALAVVFAVAEGGEEGLPV
jgi:hypothetical protein